MANLAETRYRPVLGELDPLVADIDFSSPKVVGICETLDRLGAAGRKVSIVQSPLYGGQAYLILGYEAVERGYTHLDEVPTHLMFQQPPWPDYYTHVVSAQQGNELRWHRAMNGAPLGPARVRAQVEGVLAPLANRLIDRWVDRRRVDFVAELAQPYPFDVISGLLGIPMEDRETVREYVKHLLHLQDPEASRRAHDAMSAYIRQLAGLRRKDPGQDLISYYATAEVDGRKFTDEELSDAVRFIYPAAGENSTSALGTLLYYVLSLPEVYERVRKNPDDRTAAIEESLRIRSSVQYMLRYIEKPLIIDGFEIPAKSYVMLANSSANRDPSYFEDPTKFSLDRKSNKHISFGRGANFCLGAHLARAEMRTVLDLLLARVEGLRLVPDQEIVFQGGLSHGLRSLDIEFDGLRPG